VWPVIGAVAVVIVLIAAVIVYARKQGVSDAQLEALRKANKAREREREEVDRWIGRDLLDDLHRLRERYRRSTGSLRDEERVQAESGGELTEETDLPAGREDGGAD